MLFAKWGGAVEVVSEHISLLTFFLCLDRTWGLSNAKRQAAKVESRNLASIPGCRIDINDQIPAPNLSTHVSKPATVPKVPVMSQNQLTFRPSF
jgi:hypothetical protein